MLTGNPQQASDVRLSPAGRRNDLIAQQRARVDRAALGIADRWIGRHRSLPSVILFEIDIECIAVLEFESDAPWPKTKAPSPYLPAYQYSACGLVRSITTNWLAKAR